MAEKKTPKITADDLDNEAVVGKRLAVTFKGERFELADIAHDRPWKKVVAILSAASGEQGLAATEPALAEIIGPESMDRIEEWTFADFLAFSRVVGERIGASVGTPGE